MGDYAGRIDIFAKSRGKAITGKLLQKGGIPADDVHNGFGSVLPSGDERRLVIADDNNHAVLRDSPGNESLENLHIVLNESEEVFRFIRL